MRKILGFRLTIRHVELIWYKSMGFQGNGKKIRYFRMQGLNCNQSNMLNLKTSGESKLYIRHPGEVKMINTIILLQKKAQMGWRGHGIQTKIISSL